MGLFSRLFGNRPAPVPEPVSGIQKKINIKKRDADGYYPIICPNCLLPFKIWEVEFRAGGGEAGVPVQGIQSTPTNFGLDSLFDSQDTMAMDTNASPDIPVTDSLQAFPNEEDEKFNSFEMRVAGANGGAQGKVLKIFNEDGTPTGEVQTITLMDPVTGDQSGEPIMINNKRASDFHHKPIFSLMDKYGNTQSERLCPFCHHVVSDKVGIWPSYMIGVVGNTKCGKTVYLNALGGALSKGILTGERNRLNGIGYGDRDWSILYHEMRERAAEGEEMLAGTSIKFMPPNIFNCRRAKSKDAFVLNLFDFPGEVLKKGSAETKGFDGQYKSKIPNMDGWMFLVDAASFNTVRDRLQDNEEMVSYMDLGASDLTPDELLSQFKKKYMTDGFTVPVAFVMTKSDLITYANSIIDPPPFELSPRSTFLYDNTNKRYMGNVDLNDIANSEGQLMEFFNEDYEDYGFIERAKEEADGCSIWFAISAKGTPGPHDAKPERVTEPLEWLLWRFGAIEGEGDFAPGD